MTVQDVMFVSSPLHIVYGKCFIHLNQVKVTDPEDVFLLRLNECWVTQDLEPNSTGSIHTLLDNGSVGKLRVTSI